MVRKPHKNKYILSEEFPNIRLIDQDAAVHLGDGIVTTLDALEFKMPMCILNREEANRTRFKELSPFYRRIYTDPTRLEHRTRYEAATSGGPLDALKKNAVEKISDEEAIASDPVETTMTKAALLARKEKIAARARYDAAISGDRAETAMHEWFDDTYIESVDREWEAYAAASDNKARSKVLDNMFAIDLRHTSIPEWLRDVHRHFDLQLEGNAELLERIEGLHEALRVAPDDTRLIEQIEECRQALRAASETSEYLRELDADRDVLREALKKVDDDYLRVLNDYGASIVYAKDMDTIDSAAVGCGISYPCTGIIKLSSGCITSNPKVTEEIIHYVDLLMGFSSRFEWVDGVRLDTSRQDHPLTRRMIEAIDQTFNKSSLFDKRTYARRQIPEELLTDLDKVENGFDEVVAHIRKEAAKTPNTPREIDEVAEAVSLLHIIDLKHHKGDKDSIMNAFFPHLWPLYKQFRQEVHAKAEVLRGKETGAGPDATWVDTVTTQADKSPETQKD